MKVLVIDNSLHIDNARQIAKEGHEVFYYCQASGAFPLFESGATGFGVTGIKKILDYGSYLNQADLICFFDVGFGDIASYLRDKGYNVFGAGRGEVLETNRAKSVKIMNTLGIACPETTVVYGIKQAIDFFKTAFQVKETNQSATGKYFVKLNAWRGSQDSFPVESIQLAEYMLNGLRNKFGPYAESIELIIQKTVEGRECGFDGFFNGEKFLKPMLIGFEKGNSYAGCMVDDFSIFESDIEKFTKYLASVDYRGAFSTECFFDGKVCRYIDSTCRMPSPLGLLYPTFAIEYTQLLYEIANGNAEDSHFTSGTFLGGIAISSENAKSEYLPLTVGNNTRLMRYMMQDDQCFSVPGGDAVIALACALGTSMEDVEAKAKKEAEVSSHGIFFSTFTPEFIKEIREDFIEPLNELGFDWEAITPTSNRHKLLVRAERKDADSLIEEWGSGEPIDDSLADNDPLDEIKDMVEEVSIPKIEPSRPTRKHNASVFPEKVDDYGIPL